LNHEANSTQKHEISNANISETTKAKELKFWNYQLVGIISTSIFLSTTN